MGITSSVADLPAVSQPAENSFIQLLAAVLGVNQPHYRTQNAMVCVVKSQRMENELTIINIYSTGQQCLRSLFTANQIISGIA
jgi:hypothetical protein